MNKLFQFYKIMACLGLLFACYLQAEAQATVQVGSGTTTTQYLPIYTWHGYSYSQQIYLGSEIALGGYTGAGTISKLRFYLNSGSLTNATDWTVYLGNTTKNSFSSTTDWVSVASLTQVFSGTVTATVGGWMEITLTTPFSYTGGNIVVAIDENTAGYGAISTWAGFASGTNRGLIYYSDTNNPSPSTPPTANQNQSTLSQIQFNFPSYTPCSGMPIAGTASCSSISVCSSTPFTLTNTGASAGSGFSYQWQSSLNNTTWANIAGATSTTYNTSGQSVSTYYRFMVTCNNSGQSAYSPSIQVYQNTPASCSYCTPTYSNSSSSDFLNTVSLGSINNQNSGFNGQLNNYILYPTSLFTTNLYQGYYYPISIYGSSPSVTVGVWLDYNQDGDFADTGEFVFTSSNYTNNVSGSGYLFTGNIQIPLNTNVGQTNLRIRAKWAGSFNATDYCSNATYGETEDYVVTIASAASAPACSGTPTGGTLSVLGAAYVNGNVTLSANGYTSGSAGLTYQWEMSSTSSTSGFSNVSVGTGANTPQYTTPAFTATGTQYYRMRTTCSSSGLSSYSSVYTLTINPPLCTGTPSAGTIPTAGSSTVGNTISMSSTGATTGYSGVSFQWQLSTTSATGGFGSVSGGTGATTSSFTTSAYANPGTYYYRLKCTCSNSGAISYSNVYTVTVANGACSGTPSAGTIANPPPAYVGSSIALIASNYSTAQGVSLQWQISNTTNTSTSFSNIAGATAGNYNSPIYTAVDTFYYRLEATCSYSGLKGYSSVKTVIVTNPTSACSGTPTGGTIGGSATSNVGNTLALSLSGYSSGVSGLSFQWEVSTTSTTSGFSPINGAVGVSYTTPVYSTAGTYYYRVGVTCANSGLVGYSAVKTVTVNSALCSGMPTAGTITGPNSSSIGNTVSLSASGYTSNVTGIGLQWQNSTDNITFTNISGATSANYITAAFTTSGIYYYRLAVSCSNWSATNYSNVLTVNVAPSSCIGMPNAGTITGNAMAYVNGNNALSATGYTSPQSFGGISLQWEVSTSSATSGFTSINGATSANYTTNNYTSAGTYYYRLAVTCSASSSTAYSNILTVTVSPTLCTGTPTAGIVSGNATAYVNGNNSLSASGFSSGVSGISLQWQVSASSATSGFTPISGATSANYTTNNYASVGNYYYRLAVTCSASNLTAYSNVLTVNVNPALCTGTPTAGILSGNTTAYVNGNSSLSATGFSSGVSGISLQWQVSTSSASSGFSTISGATSSNYTTNNYSSVGNYYYRFVITCSNSGQIAYSNILTVAVSLPPCIGTPVAGAISSSGVAYLNQPLTLNASGYTTGVSGITFLWEKSTTSPTAGFAPVSGGTGAATANYTTPPFSSAGIHYYRLKVTCSATNSFVYTNPYSVVVQMPNYISFQGRLEENNVPFNGQKTVEFQILGTNWAETHTNVNIIDGLYAVVLGSQISLPDDLFDQNTYKQLKVSANGTVLDTANLFAPLERDPHFPMSWRDGKIAFNDIDSASIPQPYLSGDTLYVLPNRSVYLGQGNIFPNNLYVGNNDTVTQTYINIPNNNITQQMTTDVWQSFTVPNSGTLVNIKVWFANSNNNDVILSIYQGVGTGSQTLGSPHNIFCSGGSLNTSFSQQTLTLTSPVVLQANTDYTFRIYIPNGGTCNATSTGILIGFDQNNPYNAGVSSLGGTKDLIFAVSLNSVNDYILEATPNGVIVGGGLTVNGPIQDKNGPVTPTGSIMAFAGNTAPQGWLLCNGATLSANQYPDLYAVIGNNFGGNGTTFNLPDTRGLFLRGVDGSAGRDPDKNSRTASNPGGNTGNNVGTIQGDEIKSHNHQLTTGLSASQGNGGQIGYHWVQIGDRNPDWGWITNFFTQLFGGSESRPKNLYVNYIIKY